MADHPVIGHVHLKVSDLERSIAFYLDVLGLEMQQRYGRAAAFLSWGGYHHHIGLIVWSAAGTQRESGSLYFRDPDENGIELYVDRPMEEWPRVDGEVAMDTRPLDLQSLLSEL